MAEPVRLGRAAPGGLVALRLGARDAAARAAAAAALGTALPEGPRRPTAIGGTRAFWTAPDGLLLVTGAGAAAALVETLRRGLAGHHAAAVDVTDSRTVFTVAGPGARAALAAGSGLDLHPRAFAAGEAALTRLAALAVLLTQVSGEPAFEIFAERAAEDYLWAWLGEAARGIGAVSP